MGKKEKGKNQLKLLNGDFEDIEEIFGLNEKDTYVDFKCMDCGCVDPVPDFIIDEFSYDLEEGEEVEMFCPECNGTMRRATERPETKE